MTNRMKHNIKHGFTLIEMVVVIIIVAVVSAILVPAYSHFYAKARFDGNVRDVLDVFAYAREQAIEKDAPATLTFDPQSESFSVSVTPLPPPVDQPSTFPDVRADNNMLSQTHVARLEPFMGVVGFNATDTSQGSTGSTGSNGMAANRSASSVHFRPDGTSDGAEMTLVGADSGYSAHLLLSPGTGRMQIVDDAEAQGRMGQGRR